MKADIVLGIKNKSFGTRNIAKCVMSTSGAVDLESPAFPMHFCAAFFKIDACFFKNYAS